MVPPYCPDRQRPSWSGYLPTEFHPFQPPIAVHLGEDTFIGSRRSLLGWNCYSHNYSSSGILLLMSTVSDEVLDDSPTAACARPVTFKALKIAGTTFGVANDV